MKDQVVARQNYHHGDLRIALLDAAEMELAEKGVEGFTLRGCARRAGVSHAAPAHHFKNADTLLTALAARGFENFLDRMRQRQREAASEISARVAAGLGYIDFARAQPALFRLMFSSARPDPTDPALKLAANAAHGLLVDAIRAERPTDDIADDVTASWALVHGLAELILAGRMPELDTLAGDDLDQALIRIIQRGIKQY